MTFRFFFPLPGSGTGSTGGKFLFLSRFSSSFQPSGRIRCFCVLHNLKPVGYSKCSTPIESWNWCRRNDRHSAQSLVLVLILLSASSGYGQSFLLCSMTSALPSVIPISGVASIDFPNCLSCRGTCRDSLPSAHAAYHTVIISALTYADPSGITIG